MNELDGVDTNDSEVGFHEGGSMCFLDGVLPPPVRLYCPSSSFRDVERQLDYLGY